jgi:hypothetical protein
MSDIEDAQIKTEIDEIMNGVKNIMRKIDALAPKSETEPEDKEDSETSLNSSDISSTGSS